MHGPLDVKTAATLLYVQYNTTQARAPVLQQRTAILPVPDRETVGKTFIVQGKNRNSWRAVLRVTTLLVTSRMPSCHRFLPGLCLSYSTAKVNTAHVEYTEAKEVSPNYLLPPRTPWAVTLLPPLYFPVFTFTHPAFLLTRILRVITLII
jgi:hypothetical protein